MIPGVDRSHLNSKISLASLIPKGIGFIWLKGTQADTYKDATFNAAWQEIKAIPGNLSGQLLKRGVYHFFDPRIDGVIQAKNFLSLGVNFASHGCLPPCVDVEDLVVFGHDGKVDQHATIEANKWVAKNWMQSLQRLQDFLDYVKVQTGRNVLIYTYNNYPKEYFHGHGFPNNPMWLSSLQNTCPMRYDANRLPEFWQNTYNWNGTDMDGDYFTGTIEQLNKLANIV